MNGFLTSMVTVLTAIVGVAIIAVLVSKNAKTSEVTQSFWQGFAGSLATAVSPVTGSSAGAGYMSGGGGLGMLGSQFGAFTSNMA